MKYENIYKLLEGKCTDYLKMYTLCTQKCTHKKTLKKC